MNRRGIFVTATGTEVGKTFLCALLGRALEVLEIKAGYMKPVASGCTEKDGKFSIFDVECLKTVFDGIDADPDVCPVCYEKPLAPYAASLLEGERFDFLRIKESFETLSRRFDFMIVEGVGGIMVPLQRDFFVTDLIRKMELDAIVVADGGLGTINHTMLTLDRLKAEGIKVACVLLNRCDIDRTTPDGLDVSVVSNAHVIEQLSGVKTFCVPSFDVNDKEQTDRLLVKNGLLAFIKEKIVV